MSILDGMPKTAAEFEAAQGYAETLVSQFFDKAELTEKQQEIIDLVRRGISFGEIMGITDEHKDALFAHALQLIKLGERPKARDVLLQLYIFDPLASRTIYAIATSYQLDGQFAGAAQLFIQFLALDATNPDGHLRLGECLLAAQEYDEAQKSFETAARLAERGDGKPEAALHAQRMLAVVAERRSVAG